MVLVRVAHQNAMKGDLRHPHGEALYDDVGVKGLHDVARDQTVVDAGVLVLLELGELVLANVHHGCEVAAEGVMPKGEVRRGEVKRVGRCCYVASGQAACGSKFFVLGQFQFASGPGLDGMTLAGPPKHAHACLGAQAT